MTQYDKVLDHLKKYGTITSWVAIMRYRITRLSAVILLLRNDGYRITSEMKYSKENRYAIYRLEAY